MATTSSPAWNPLTPGPTSTTTPATSVTAEDGGISRTGYVISQNTVRKDAHDRIVLSYYRNEATTGPLQVA